MYAFFRAITTLHCNSTEEGVYRRMQDSKENSFLLSQKET